MAKEIIYPKDEPGLQLDVRLKCPICKTLYIPSEIREYCGMRREGTGYSGYGAYKAYEPCPKCDHICDEYDIIPKWYYNLIKKWREKKNERN